jgi:periplasmic protein TonB
MDSPRSGFRRATAASWTLAGLGIAGVAGASSLAYADTYKPPVTDDPVYVVEEPASEIVPAPLPVLPPPVDHVTPTVDVPPPPPPVTAAVPTPEYTPRYTPQQQPVVQAAAPITQQAPSVAPKPPTSSTRRRLTPALVMPPKASPRVTASHGS